jgi:hypothetical protein
VAERIRPPPAEEHLPSRAPYGISIRRATVNPGTGRRAPLLTQHRRLVSEIGAFLAASA